MSVPYYKIIINPAAGGYSIRKEWPRISRQLKDIGLSFDYEYSEGAGHAIELARGAVDDGYHHIIAVGGDGTVNEVANGILSSTNSDKVTLGIVSAGTACSFALSLGIPRDPISACSLLARQGRLLIDVGVVQYTSEGQSLKRYFVNEADVGFGAALLEASPDFPKRFGRTINYAPRVIGGLRSLLRYHNRRVALRVENENEDISVCAMVVVANGRYLGGEMRIAPHAKLDDGLLDMVVVGDIGKSELMKIWTMTYRGSHITHPKIKTRKITRVTIESSERILVEADGEILGEGPASFWILPSALTVAV